MGMNAMKMKKKSGLIPGQAVPAKVPESKLSK